MTERGIIFTPENYGKIEDGHKTQTRRIIKLQPVGDVEWFGCHRSSNPKQDGQWTPMKGDPKDIDCWEQAAGPQIRCPYGLPGDRLYVKEGLQPEPGTPGVRYRRDRRPVMDEATGTHYLWEWKNDYLSPMHMPKWAARLWLEITDVRVEKAFTDYLEPGEEFKRENWNLMELNHVVSLLRREQRAQRARVRRISKKLCIPGGNLIHRDQLLKAMHGRTP